MKLVAKILALILALLIVAVVLLVLLVDVNRFKPHIEAIAKEQGVALQMGNLGWAFWPSLGVSVADIKVAALDTPQESIAELSKADLMLALMPLFKGEFKVNYVQVDGARIYLVVDEQGKANWDALLPSDSAATTTTSSKPDREATSAGLNLEISRLGINNSALSYTDKQTGQVIQLHDLNLDMTDVNTHANPFALTVNGVMEILPPGAVDKLQLESKLSAQITVDENLSHLQIDDGKAHFMLGTKSPADITLDYVLSVNELQNNPRYQGQVDVQPFNLQQVLAALGVKMEPANSDALQKLSLSTPITGDTKQLALDSFKLTLDKTHMSGSLAVTDFSTSALKLVVQGDSINVDDYLPAASDTPDPEKITTSTSTSTSTEETSLPLEMLRGLNLDVKVSMAAIEIKKIILNSMSFTIQANEGVIEQQFSAEVAQGNVNVNSHIDLRANIESETSGAPNNNFNYRAQLELESLNLRQLLTALNAELETANSDALKKFSLSANVKGDTKQASLDALKLTLDKTHFTGSAAVTDFATRALKLALQGDSINVDDYLSPVSETPIAEGAASPTEDTPLPLDTLRELNLDARVGMSKMTIKKMDLANIDLRINANKGVVEQKLTARGYQGDIKFNSQMDARAEKARLDFDGGVQGLELAPLLKDMKVEGKLDLSGAIQMQTRGTTQGASVNQLIESMNSTANFSGAQVRMSPLNIEEQFCKMVNLITQKSSEEITWDNFTEMRQLNGNIVWRDQVINLESFNAGVSQLLLASTGKINLAKEKYEFKLPIKLEEASKAASLKGCTLSSPSYWVDRSLSLLRCKGSLGAVNPLKDCGFDKSALGDLTKDFAEYKLREKHGAKIDAAEQKLKDKKQELLDRANDKLGGEGSVTKPKDILNNLLKKKLGGETASSASASSVASQQ